MLNEDPTTPGMWVVTLLDDEIVAAGGDDQGVQLLIELGDLLADLVALLAQLLDQTLAIPRPELHLLLLDDALSDLAEDRSGIAEVPQDRAFPRQDPDRAGAFQVVLLEHVFGS